MTPPSRRQRDVLLSIAGFVQANHYPPSLAELCTLTGVRSRSTIFGHIEGLVTKGFLRKTPHRARSYELTMHGYLLLPPP